MTKAEEKKALRQIMAQIEAGLSPRYMAQADKAIAAHLLSLPEYMAARTVFSFVSVRREIDTFPILQDALKSGKRLCVPLCVGPGIMEPREITDLSRLRPGRYGLLEPDADAPKAEIDDIDFALLPCTACSHLGQRLGKGGGYYDRFLAHYRSAAVVVCREKQIREEIPVEPHDYPIPWVMTEKGLYEDGTPARLY